MRRGTYISPLTLGSYTLPLDKRTLVMGIINVTPDSFSGDGVGRRPGRGGGAGMAGCKEEGADILDIGGESTRPGSDPVSEVEEIRRVLPLVERLAGPGGVGLPLSVDTRRSVVAEAALQAGAHIINDITGLRDDPGIARVVAEHGAGLVLMHIKGTPRDMQQDPHYDDLLGEVTAYLREGVEKAVEAGVPRERILGGPRHRFRQDARPQLGATEKAG